MLRHLVMLAGKEGHRTLMGEIRDFMRVRGAARYSVGIAREAFQNAQVTLGMAEAQLEETEAELGQMRVEMPLTAGRLQVTLNRIVRRRAVIGSRRVETRALDAALQEQ